MNSLDTQLCITERSQPTTTELHGNWHWRGNGRLDAPGRLPKEMKVKWDPEGCGPSFIILREEWALEKARGRRIMNRWSWGWKLALHSGYNVPDEPIREFRPHLSQANFVICLEKLQINICERKYLGFYLMSGNVNIFKHCSGVGLHNCSAGRPQASACRLP